MKKEQAEQIYNDIKENEKELLNTNRYCSIVNYRVEHPHTNYYCIRLGLEDYIEYDKLQDLVDFLDIKKFDVTIDIIKEERERGLPPKRKEIIPILQMYIS